MTPYTDTRYALANILLMTAIGDWEQSELATMDGITSRDSAEALKSKALYTIELLEHNACELRYRGADKILTAIRNWRYGKGIA